MEGRARLEKLFYRRTVGLLQKGGIIVMIIPHYSLDSAFSDWIARHFTSVKAYLAPEQQYKQVVLFGIRREVDDVSDRHTIRQQLARIGQGELPPVLPEIWLDEAYTVPAIKTGVSSFCISRLDARQLAEMRDSTPGLWSQFTLRFSQALTGQKQPLMDLSQWHLALALAAGQMSGAVTSRDGRTYLIRGSTYKTQTERVICELDEEGKETWVRIRLDRFVPTLRALDMTPNGCLISLMKGY